MTTQFLFADGHKLEYQWIAPQPQGGADSPEHPPGVDAFASRLPATDAAVIQASVAQAAASATTAAPRLPTIVYLHQGLGSVAMWRDFPARLAARTGCGTLVYSRYGHGQSDVLTEPRPLDFMAHEGAVVLPEILRALQLDDVILIGHSDGGTAALHYAARGLPLRALVVVAPHVCIEPATIDAIAAQYSTWNGSVLRERLARYHRDVDATFNGWVQVWEKLRAIDWTIESELRHISCPVLAIQGRLDTHGTMVHIERIAQLARGPVTLEKLEACGHDPFRDQTERMLELLSAFIATHDSA